MLIEDECHANNALILRENVHVFINYKQTRALRYDEGVKMMSGLTFLAVYI